MVRPITFVLQAFRRTTQDFSKDYEKPSTNDYEKPSTNKATHCKAEMLIRKPVAKVFEAFINPEITRKFLVYKKYWKLGSRAARHLDLGSV